MKPIVTNTEKSEIICDSLCCGYNSVILENLSFRLKQGECLCILGSNGVGKSTLIKTILNQVPIIRGNIYIDKNSVKQCTKTELARSFTYVPQVVGYSFNYSVIDIVLMGRTALLHNFASPSYKDMEKAISALSMVDMESYKERNYSELSCGEQQMVLMARSICQESKFLLLDEPTSNLDYKNQKKLLKLILELKRLGKGIIMVSHDPNHAGICGDKTLMLKNTNTYYFGGTETVLTKENLVDIYNVDVVLNSFDNNRIISFDFNN